MASIVVTLRIMPEDTKTDLKAMEPKVKKAIEDFCDSTQFKFTIEPIAFGLKSLNAVFVMDESIGSTDELEKKIENMKGVNSVEVIDVRRSVG